MRIFALVFSAFVLLGLSGCKSACEDGYYYTCLRRERMTECSSVGRGGVVCRDRELCVRYGCTKDPFGRFSASVPASTLGLTAKPAFKISEIPVSSALSMIANGDMLAAQDMGFEVQDFFALIDGRSLPESRVSSIARLNGESETTVAKKIETINAEFQSQRYDFKSPYWQTCVATGRWSTDRNSRCEKSYWPGCSPEQGASLCVSAVGASRFGL